MPYSIRKTFLTATLVVLAPLVCPKSCRESLTTMNANKSGANSYITVTVFVHGTMSIRHFLTLNNFMRMMRDEVENSIYHKSLDIARENPLFFVNQAMQGPGLQQVDHQSICPGNASGCLAQLLMLAEHNVSIQNKLPSDQLFYTFGWPGVLSHNLRVKAGQELCRSLAKQVDQLQTTYDKVFVRIYGFSHGGNVALNMAQCADNLPQFTVDELILLGTPIQSESDYLINSPLFAKVFNVFSAGDMVQQLDCFSFSRFFSHKQFTARPGFTLPDKLTQMELRLTEPVHRHRHIHKETSAHTDLRKNPYLRDHSPGHSELWFFGWTPQYYRSHFPLNPLPTVTLLPLILTSPRLAALPPHKHWIIDIRPSLEYCLVRLAKDRTVHPPIPLKAPLIARLKQHAELFRPDPIIQKQYDDITYDAMKQALKAAGATKNSTVAHN